ncbi:MAG: peroxiredoxin [Bacteroidetes bacterium]|nr:peroxiredoxin [Bacteroidota bacterium]MDA1122010.1 peroxiredoxin [Bacteroidota bacterium]
MVKIGDALPHFILPDENENPVNISDYIGEEPIIVFFYPKDDTPGCIVEACSFRDNYDEFKLKGVMIFGISSDDYRSHLNFKKKYSLPFPLLSDEDLAVHKMFGVTKTLGIFPGRKTYIADWKGFVRNIFNSQLFPKRHVSEALNAINRL